MNTLSDKTNILAIETSCDDTSVAIMSNGIVKSNVVSTQKIHEKYGGVIPEAASRLHNQQLLSVIQEALEIADMNINEIELIAYTQGPGLMGSLLVGSSFAKSLSLSLQIPLIGINHLEAHIAAIFIENKKIEFPFICLLVSGGHTLLLKVTDIDKYYLIGKTLDDAAGEAFDKCAKIFGLTYPGGPIIDKLSKKGNPIFQFSVGNVGDYDFSFSGFKTSVLYFIQSKIKENPNFINENIHDLCASVQNCIINYLVKNTINAALNFGIYNICIVGGVSANSYIMQAFKNKNINLNITIPSIHYCTDNAAMVAQTALLKLKKEKFGKITDKPYARSLDFIS